MTFRSTAYKFAVLFVIGIVFSLAFDGYAVAASQSGNMLSSLMEQFNFPSRITTRVLETVGLFVSGILFCIALDRWFSKQAALSGNTPLAEQARRLKQLKSGIQKE